MLVSVLDNPKEDFFDYIMISGSPTINYNFCGSTEKDTRFRNAALAFFKILR
jgi:hypothetical protein